MKMADRVHQPASSGERQLQIRYGTEARAAAFYREQVLDHLNPAMQAFIERMEMMFVATTDAQGRCDCSLRCGPPGFVRVLDASTLIYPEYRGNGVMASLGNISETGSIGLLFVDWFESTVGLHVNGRAAIVENEALAAQPDIPPAVRADLAVAGGRHPERWVRVTVEEAYIHCAKHVPRLIRGDKTLAWGTDDARLKGGDFFGVRAARLASRLEPPSGK